VTRILVNAVHARAGGGLTYLRHLLPLLAGEPDLEIALIPHPSQAEAFAVLLPEIPIHRPAMPAGWAALLLWEQFRLPSLARHIGYDVLFSPANFGPLAIRRQVIVLHNAPGVGAQERRLGKRLYWLALRVMTALSLAITREAIAVSQYVADATRSRFLPQHPATIIHHGVDAAFSPGAPFNPSARLLLAVGDMYIQKNLLSLIEALALVRQSHPETMLAIAGAPVDEEYATSVRRRIADLGLHAAVTFFGHCDGRRLVGLYRDCSVFVFPSLEESFGMPLVEAMACGAPVVASDRAAMPEVTGGAALLCDARDPVALADAIRRVIDDAALRKRLREQSLARAAAFSWPDCARRTAAVLRRAAG
jgi:glycosyltransferase involved in cell wall biosynthesis